MTRQFQIRTSDPEEFQARIAPVSGDCRVRPVRGHRFDIAARGASLDGLSLFMVRSPTLNVCIAPPHDYFCVNLPLGRPFVAITDSGRRESFGRDGHLLAPQQTMCLESGSGMRALAIKLDTDRVNRTHGQLSGTTKPLALQRENRLLPITPLFNRFLHEVTELWSVLRNGGGAVESNWSVSERVDEIFAAFVESTRHDRGSSNQGCAAADVACVKRAEDWLDAHLTEPVSRAELAGQSGVSIRSLSRGFARRWGVGPMQFLRSRRMFAAHCDLLGAEPGATSVTDVATRYGFTHLGRFSQDYWRSFHELPSQTLRQ